MSRGSTFAWRLAAHVAGVALLLAPASTTARPDASELRLADSPEELAALGLTDRIEPREDGRRTPQGRPNYEWWYFDAELDDGSFLVVQFADNWPNGTSRTVHMALTPPGQKTRHFMREYREPGVFARDRADIRIGPHRFEGDLETYTIKVDAADTGGLGCQLTLRRFVPSYRPASGHVFSGKDFFAWFVAVPDGGVLGHLTIDGRTQAVSGRGYHDHNWGNTDPSRFMDRWWWGRGRSGAYTFLAFELQGRASQGSRSVSSLFVARDAHTLVSAFGEGAKASSGPEARHPDPGHDRTIASSVTFSAANGTRARFEATNFLLLSHDGVAEAAKAMVAADPVQGPALVQTMRRHAKAANAKPWYSRFATPVSLVLPGKPPMRGEGVIEYHELR